MGKTTIKRLAILCGALLLVGGGGYVLWGYQVGRMARSVVERAERAEQEGDYERARELYQQHLSVVPDDVEVQLRYAEALLHGEGAERRREDALQIFEGVLSQSPGRVEVRRRAAEVAFAIGGALLERARGHLEILLKTPGKDPGHLEYMLARCLEQDGRYAPAAAAYERAIHEGAAGEERLDAHQRLATLLVDPRAKLNQPKKARQVIDEMIASAPKDARAYLGRGRYRVASGDGKGALEDFRKALELAPGDPDVHLEVARAVERASGPDAAHPVLERGLAAAPKSVELHAALSALEQRAGRLDRAVEALERGLKARPDHLGLRWQLGLLLAGRGETGRLDLQAEELSRLGANSQVVRYLRAYSLLNGHKYAQALAILAPLQSDVARMPALKAGVNVLLSRCYAEMGEPEQQRDAMARAYNADPTNLPARLGYIQGLVARGDRDAAIREYRGLLKDQPGPVRLPLAGLLIDQNRELDARMPAAQRDSAEAKERWDEVERLIGDAAAAAPGAVEPSLMRLRMREARGEDPQALADELEAIRRRFPRDARPWIAQVALLASQRRFDEAQATLDRARERLGDRVDLRLARAGLANARGGPGAAAIMEGLARDIDRFPRDERRALLRGLADAMVRLPDRPGAVRVLSRLVEEEPEALQPRLQLFDLALQAGDVKQAEKYIPDIERLDPQFAGFCRAQCLIRRAGVADDPAARARDRDEARGLLTELRARRPDWSKVPLALAKLDEAEIADARMDETREREALEAPIAGYRRAIELGLRDPAEVRHYIQLLFRAKRGAEALETYTLIPAGAGPTGNLERMASEAALTQRDYQKAVEIARKAVAARPEDFQARVWLARVLMQERQGDEAVKELEKAKEANPRDPDRWLVLLKAAVLTNRPEKAEQVARDAEEKLAGVAGAPMALAQCCGILGRAYAAVDPERARPWYDRARHWFDEAQKALKDPSDQSVRRRLVEFLVQTDQASEAEGPLKEILRGSEGRSPDLAAWARRTLAQVYAVASPPRLDEAQALLAGKEGRAADPDDLRVLARIHEAQGTADGRRRAIADLEALAGRNGATAEDRLRLAQLLDSVGEWPRAREQFLELLQLAQKASDPETIARRPQYLELFVDALIRHHRPGDVEDIEEARRRVGEIGEVQRGGLAATVLEARVDRAAGRPDAARARLLDAAGRPGVDPSERMRLADAADRIGQLDAAEALYRRLADEPPVDPNGLPNRFRLAIFYARHDRLKEAVDVCEALWADPALRERVAALCTQFLADPSLRLDPAQAGRVVAWLERARAEGARSLIYLIGLGNIYERLGEYGKAEAMYREAIKANDRDGLASNNLAWLLTLEGGGRAEGDRAREALGLINNAIRARGPLAEFLDTRGMIYLAAGDGPRAVADLEAAFKAAPTPPKYFHLAQAYLRVNKKEEARKLLEAGKARGLPGGLHPLEVALYTRVTSELGRP